MKNIICSISGTQNTGKTTFVKDVINNFDNFKTSTVSYRDIIEKHGLKINRNGNIVSQKLIFNSLIDQTIQFIKLRNNCILDRNVMDSLAYTMYLYNHKIGDVTSNDIDDMIYQTNKILQLLDVIMYIPLSECSDISVVDDKFRDTNLEYRKEVDNIFIYIIDNIIDTSLIKKLYYIHGNREERLKRFKEIIDNNSVK